MRASAASRWILVFHPPRDLPIACGPFFLSARAIGMHLDAGAVQRHRLDLDLHHLRLLQLLKRAVKHAGLGPAAHSGVDRVPVAEALWQTAPFATVLGHVQDGIEHLEIGQADVAALRRQAVFNLGELSWRDLHSLTVDEAIQFGN